MLSVNLIYSQWLKDWVFTNGFQRMRVSFFYVYAVTRRKNCNINGKHPTKKNHKTCRAVGVVKEITRCQFNISIRNVYVCVHCSAHKTVVFVKECTKTQIHLIPSWFCEKNSISVQFFILTFHYLDSSYWFHQNNFLDIFWTVIWNLIFFFRCRCPRGNHFTESIATLDNQTYFHCQSHTSQLEKEKEKGWTKSNRKRKKLVSVSAIALNYELS